MKKLILILTVLVAFQGFSQSYSEEEFETSNLNWLLDFDQAKLESQKTKKPIVIYFTGSDWCGPCKMLKQDFFSSEKFEKLANDLVLVKVDIPRRRDIVTPEQLEKNHSLVRKYNKKGGYPNLVAVDGKGKVIGELSGYTFLRETDRHFNFIQSILENY